MSKQEVECNETERVVTELMMEIAQLREERDFYKFNYELLHNKIETKDASNNEGGYTDQEFDELAKAYADFGY